MFNLKKRIGEASPKNTLRQTDSLWYLPLPTGSPCASFTHYLRAPHESIRIYSHADFRQDPEAVVCLANRVVLAIYFNPMGPLKLGCLQYLPALTNAALEILHPRLVFADFSSLPLQTRIK